MLVRGEGGLVRKLKIFFGISVFMKFKVKFDQGMIMTYVARCGDYATLIKTPRSYLGIKFLFLKTPIKLLKKSIVNTMTKIIQ